MANQYTERVRVEFTGDVNVSKTTESARKLAEIMTKNGLDKASQKSAQNYLSIMILAEQKLKSLREKGSVTQKELNSAKKYASDIQTGYQKLIEMSSAMSGKVPVDEMNKINALIDEANMKQKEGVKTIRDEFERLAKETVGRPVKFINAQREIDEMKMVLLSTASNAQIAAEEKARIDNETLPERQRIAKKLMAAELAEYNKITGSKLKSYDKFIKDTEKLEEESARQKAKIIKPGDVTGVAAARLFKAKTGTDKDVQALGLENISTVKQLNDALNKNKTTREEIEKLVRNSVRTESKAAEEVYNAQQKELGLRKKVTDVLKEQNKILLEKPKDVKKAGLEAGFNVSKTSEYKTRASQIDLVQNSYSNAVLAQNELNRITQQSITTLNGQAVAMQKVADTKLGDAFNSVRVPEEELLQTTVKLNSAIGQSQSQMLKASVKAQAFGKMTDDLRSRVGRLISVYYIWMKAVQEFNKAKTIVSSLDEEMMQIGIVTKQTTKELWNSFDAYNSAARELSTTTKQYLEGAKIFYQQGMNTAEVMSMVEATTKAAVLAGVDFRSASETLTAAIKGYNMEATKAMDVTDKFAAVGAQSAADFNELSVAMEKVASQAYSSGMSFDSLLGILAKGIETTREAPEAIGTGLKSIIARFQELKENPMTNLEDGINANRVEAALKSVGVALRDSNGEFRNMDEVFADLGEAWKTMSRNQRAYIATMAAGSR